MQSQWEFYKIAQKSAVSIKNHTKSFLEDLLDSFVIYEKFSMGTQGWILTQPVLSLTMTKDNP